MALDTAPTMYLIVVLFYIRPGRVGHLRTHMNNVWRPLLNIVSFSGPLPGNTRLGFPPQPRASRAPRERLPWGNGPRLAPWAAKPAVLSTEGSVGSLLADRILSSVFGDLKGINRNRNGELSGRAAAPPRENTPRVSAAKHRASRASRKRRLPWGNGLRLAPRAAQLAALSTEALFGFGRLFGNRPNTVFGVWRFEKGVTETETENSPVGYSVDSYTYITIFNFTLHRAWCKPCLPGW